jgi:hypothetical protein
MANFFMDDNKSQFLKPDPMASILPAVDEFLVIA